RGVDHEVVQAQGAHGEGGRARVPGVGGGERVGTGGGVGRGRQGGCAGPGAEAHRGRRVGGSLAGRRRAGGQARPGDGLGPGVGRGRVVVEVVGREGRREGAPRRGCGGRGGDHEVVQAEGAHREGGRARVPGVGGGERVGTGGGVGRGRQGGCAGPGAEAHRGRRVGGSLAGRRRAGRQARPGDGLGPGVGRGRVVVEVVGREGRREGAPRRGCGGRGVDHEVVQAQGAHREGGRAGRGAGHVGGGERGRLSVEQRGVR